MGEKDSGTEASEIRNGKGKRAKLTANQLAGLSPQHRVANLTTNQTGDLRTQHRVAKAATLQGEKQYLVMANRWGISMFGDCGDRVWDSLKMEGTVLKLDLGEPEFS